MADTTLSAIFFAGYDSCLLPAVELVIPKYLPCSRP
jgi:hypothetical protein